MWIFKFTFPKMDSVFFVLPSLLLVLIPLSIVEAKVIKRLPPVTFYFEAKPGKGVITGRVLWEGPIPEPELYTDIKDKTICETGQINEHAPKTKGTREEQFTHVQNGALQHAVVALEGIKKGALLQSEWVIMGCFSDGLEHTGQDFQAEILLIA